ncbi:MAG TPA: aminotransferase class I/II-fold pyridoxal phosphate-dependent enzyme [Acidimicrobiales bacterium]|nr:aminotransferase class I/II-fold pyridoxal phosphate-dependent enzyme [Acidimicrobiales bacterium]
MSARPAFEPPPYPYDRLAGLADKAAAHQGGVVDLSVGTPCDPAPPAVVSALSSSGAEPGYPASIGSLAYRSAAAAWMRRRLGVDVAVDAVAACVGTKELVATLPQWLRLRRPDRDTVLYPAVSYPTYEMGAVLAGCRAVPVAVDSGWRLDLGSVAESDAERALVLWANSPGNPCGQVDDLGALAAWARGRGVLVFSDECYVEHTYAPAGPRTILQHGSHGVVAVHSLSKRSNLAGLRAGFYAGDGDVVRYLSEVRKHAGLFVAGPVQAAAVVALDDDDHVSVQRARYLERLDCLRAILGELGVEAPLPEGGLYLWAPAPGGDAWGFTEQLAVEGGVLVSPGDFYGAAGAGHVRIAAVQPLERIELVRRRLLGR